VGCTPEISEMIVWLSHCEAKESKSNRLLRFSENDAENTYCFGVCTSSNSRRLSRRQVRFVFDFIS